MMAPREDIILWLDIETTGSSPDADMLEIALALTDPTPDLNIISNITMNVRPTNPDKLFNMDKVVMDMHEKSGLFREIIQRERTYSIWAVDTFIDQWLNENAGRSTAHIPYAGSGVAHFDRQFIRRDLPMLNKRITYWAYDVGVLRRMLRLAGIEFPEGDQSTKTHRALDDVKQHIEEARVYLNYLKERA